MANPNTNARILYQGGTGGAKKADPDAALFAGIKIKLAGRTVPQFVAQVLIPAQRAGGEDYGRARSAIKHYNNAVLPIIRRLQALDQEVKQAEQTGKITWEQLYFMHLRYDSLYSDAVFEINRMLRLWEMV